MQKLGNPKSGEDRPNPGQAWLKNGEAQGFKGLAEKEEPGGKINKAGEGAKDRMMGQAAVAKEQGVRPPDKSQTTPPAGRPAGSQIQIRGEKKASQKVAQTQRNKLGPQTETIGGPQNRGKKNELEDEMDLPPGHSPILPGHDNLATQPATPYNGFSTQKPKVLTQGGDGMKIKPLGSRVLVKKLEEEERRTPGGIVLPESVKDEKAVKGEVVALGTGEKFEVKVGDKVLIAAYAGTEVRVGEEKYLLVKTADILAVIEE